MAVTSVDGEDKVSSHGLRESDSSVLKTVIVDESFSLSTGVSNHPCQGGEYVKISQRGALFVVYDHVSPVGRVVSVGVIDPEEVGPE